MCRLQFGIAATQSLGLPQTAERRCRGLGAFFWLLGSAGSGNTYSLWDHQNRADPGLGLVVADTANVPSRPQNMVVAAFLEKDLFFNGLLTLGSQHNIPQWASHSETSLEMRRLLHVGLHTFQLQRLHGGGLPLNFLSKPVQLLALLDDHAVHGFDRFLRDVRANRRKISIIHLKNLRARVISHVSFSSGQAITAAGSYCATGSACAVRVLLNLVTQIHNVWSIIFFVARSCEGEQITFRDAYDRKEDSN